MKEKILELLNEIEQQYSIHILYACELGSRVYGYNQAQSDYDIRFIFTHPIKKYLGIYRITETIEMKKGEIELHGWELKKAMKLSLKSNPSLAEWLNSSIIYKETTPFREELQHIVETSYSRVTLIKHYAGIFQKNIQRSENISTYKQIKSFLHGLRSLLCINYIVKKKDIPPVELEHLLIIMDEEELKTNIKSFIEKVKDRKIINEKEFFILRDQSVTFFNKLQNEFKKFEHIVPSIELLNDFVLKWLWEKREF